MLKFKLSVLRKIINEEMQSTTKRDKMSIMENHESMNITFGSIITIDQSIHEVWTVDRVKTDHTDMTNAHSLYDIGSVIVVGDPEFITVPASKTGTSNTRVPGTKNIKAVPVLSLNNFRRNYKNTDPNDLPFQARYRVWLTLKE